MARTPLLRSLKTLAADYAEAARRGTSLNAIQELRSSNQSIGSRAHSAAARAGLDRREFLKVTAVLGAAAACSPALTGRAGAAAGARIAIVGAGAAGLTAALTLADQGVASTVYESADRVGGRMHSDRRDFWLDGQTAEWCGELIDTNHKTILSLAQRFRLPVVDLVQAQPNRSEDTYFFAGTYYPRAQAASDFKPVHQAISADLHAAPYPTTYQTTSAKAIALDTMSLYDWIESRVRDGHASPMGQLLDVAYTIEFGAETMSQSALNLIYLLGFQPSPGNFSIFGLSDERYHVAGGNEQLPEAIATTLPAGSLKLGWRLVAIALNSDGSIALTFQVGNKTTVITADHVLLAFHFGVLRTIDTRRAGFDALKQQAIRQLGLGANAKLQLQFDLRYWNQTGPWPGIGTGSSFADTGYQNTWDATRAQAGARGILVDDMGGDVASAFTPSAPYSDSSARLVRAVAQSFLTQLEPVYPGISAQWNGKATLSVPALDPSSNCSYSYYKVGQYHAFAGYEGRRQGNIHFAGEHTSLSFQGYMEGGAAEGVRAAAEIGTDLGK